MMYLTHEQNLAVTATVGASSSHPVYPIANIVNPRFSKAWRSNNVLTDVDITIDLGSAIPTNLAGLFNTNLTPAATVVHAAGTTSGVADYSQSILWREFDEYSLLEGTINYEFHRLRINDTGNPDGFIEAAYLPLGQASMVPVNHRYEGSPFPGGLDIVHIAENMKQRSEFGQPLVDKLYKSTQFSFSFGDMPTVYRRMLLDWLNGLEEEATPMVWIPDPDVYDGWYVRLITSVRELYRQFHSLGPITLQTDGRGKRMAA